MVGAILAGQIGSIDAHRSSRNSTCLWAAMARAMPIKPKTGIPSCHQMFTGNGRPRRANRA
jgi:hypothetical protein